MSRAPWRDQRRPRSYSKDRGHVDSWWSEDRAKRRRRSDSRPKEDSRWSGRWSSQDREQWRDRRRSRSRAEGEHRNVDARWHESGARWENWRGSRSHSRPKEDRRYSGRWSSQDGEQWRNRQRSRSRAEGEHRNVDARWHESGARWENWRGSRSHSRPKEDHRYSGRWSSQDGEQWRNRQRSRSRAEGEHRNVDASWHESGARWENWRGSRSRAHDDRSEANGLRHGDHTQRRNSRRSRSRPEEKAAPWHSNAQRHEIDFRDVTEEVDEDRGRSRSRQRLPTAPEEAPAEETMTVPQSMLGRIIGRKGTKINDIRKESGAHIDIDKPSKEDVSCGLLIRGSDSSVARAKELISELMQVVNQERGQSVKNDDWSEETVEIPLSMIGDFIGKGGEKVNKLQDDSGAKIDVDKTGKVSIRGPTDSVVQAIDMIAELMDGAAEKHISVAEDEAVEETIEVPLTMVGRIIGKAGETVRKLEVDSGAKIQVNDKDRPPTVYLRGSGEAVTCAIDLITSLTHKDPIQSAVQGMLESEESMELPLSQAGKIIGARGASISKMREQSGAKIEVIKEQHSCRVVISGTPEQICHAQDMIRSLADASLKSPAAKDAGSELVEETLDVPPRLLGRIFGKGGQTIMKLQEDSGAKINVDKLNSNVVHLRGSRDCVARARDLIATVLGESADRVEEAIDVPSKMLGRIFGHGGKNIMKMQDDSGAKINVDKANPNVISLSGSPECVARARDLIVDWLAAEANAVEETMWVPPQCMGLLIGKRGETIMKLQVESGAKINADKVKKNAVHISGSSECVSRAQQMIADMISEGDDQIEETVHVPSSRLGRIFGHGGEHIMKLQDVSGAKIDVDKVSLDRVQLSGSTKCVAEAKTLLLELFADPQVEGQISPFWAKMETRLQAKDLCTASQQKLESHGPEPREARPKPSAIFYPTKLESGSRDLSNAAPKPSQAPHLCELGSGFEDLDDEI